MLQNLKSL